MDPKTVVRKMRGSPDCRTVRFTGQYRDLTHENCPRNTLGASRKSARETVTVVGHGKWAVDDVSRGDHHQVRQGVWEGCKEGQGACPGSGDVGDGLVAG